jgi:hypothetical protein
MNRLKLVLAALVLTVAAIGSTPPAYAVDWCQMCDASPQDCYSCCRCGGGGHPLCKIAECNG